MISIANLVKIIRKVFIPVPSYETLVIQWWNCPSGLPSKLILSIV
ncbi:MAG: hypothetical protein ACLPHE_04590 [Methanobacterium sp.]